ncbi:P-loop containing nucleoside triphosphate hydrolase protein [Xylaria acuta]|nr:P-loop containing nucleoside triphosphate hydrolase protein [Xylaria acuta]
MASLRSPRDPSRKVQVICAGYARTGTSTMALAVEQLLDRPFLHGGTQVLDREDAYCKKWVQVYEANAGGDKAATLSLLREVTAGFIGVADMPPLDFIPELMELHPEAKVVLVERDSDRWLESLMVVPGWRWFPSLVKHYGESAKRIMQFEPKGEVKRGSSNLMCYYIPFKREMVPPEKLLVMQLKDGWAPLCKFLGVPVPDGPLPRANNTEAALEISDHVTRRLAQIWGTAVGTAAVIGFGAWRAWKTR